MTRLDCIALCVFERCHDIGFAVGRVASSTNGLGIWHGCEMNIPLAADTFTSVGERSASQLSSHLLQLPGRAWAWELLRRNPQYQADFDAGDHGKAAERWGLLRLEDPAKPATEADTFWSSRLARDVLDLVAQPLRDEGAAPTIALEDLQCRTVQHDGDCGTRNILFAEGGRSLQIAVSGSAPLTNALLLTPVLPIPGFSSERLFAVRRFTDLVKHGWLRPSLYPSERGAKRYAHVVTALDGWLEGRPHREIAVTLFGSSWVDRAWNDSGNHLRDRVRRAIRYGRELMDGGYRRFLT